MAHPNRPPDPVRKPLLYRSCLFRKSYPDILMMQPLDRLIDRALHEDLTNSPDARLGGLPHAGNFLASKATHVHHSSRRCHSTAALETTREYLAIAIRAPVRGSGVDAAGVGSVFEHHPAVPHRARTTAGSLRPRHDLTCPYVLGNQTEESASNGGTLPGQPVRRVPFAWVCSASGLL